MCSFGSKKYKKVENKGKAVHSKILTLLQLWFQRTESCSRPAFFGRFVPNIWSIKTERCFSTFSFYSGDRKRTRLRQSERSGRFVMQPEIRNVFWL